MIRVDETRLRQTILDLAKARGPGKTICPSEAARAIAGPDEKQWRLLMKPLRAQAVAMAKAGEITILRKGRPVDPDDFRGVYRIAMAADGQGDGKN